MEDLFKFMFTVNYPDQTIWYVAYNDDNVFYNGTVDPETCLATGQPFLSTFNTFEEALSTFPQAYVGYVPVSTLEPYVDVISKYPDIWNTYLQLSAQNPA